MKIKITLFFILAAFTFNNVAAQTNINDYKYVIVPNTFDFLKELDQYRLNTLTKLLLEKHGFTTIMENEILPDDAISNNCLALNANVLKEPGAFNSKLKVQLKDCKNNIVFTSNVGKSREKSFQVAYTLALREAFKSFDTFKYQYKESARILGYAKKDTQVNNDEIEKLKKEIKTLKEEKQVITEVPKKVVKKEVVKKEVVKKEVVKKEVVAVKEVVKKETVAVKPIKQQAKDLDVLYAQKMANGFQLVDSTPKVIYKIKKTGMPNVYLVADNEAIIYLLDSKWILEYYENEVLKTKELHIKF